MIVKLLTDHHLEFLSFKGGYTGSSESTLVKMPHCWESHVAAQMLFTYLFYEKNNAICLQNSNLSSKQSVVRCVTVGDDVNGCVACYWN